jgi:Holliday junction resolvase RusA-like endonuclease
MGTSKIIDHTIYMEPRPQLRPRFSARNGFVQAFPPKENKQATVIIQQSLELYKENMPYPKPLAVGLEMTFFKPLLKSGNMEYPIGKPDLSNYIKQLEDSIEGLMMDNDSQIVTIVAHKRYCQPGEQPRVEIKLWEVI